jgi:inosine-uridine nucleoside N-ribohydrolase
MPEKLLFDTDIGSDIDDAVALAWLLANPECELVGITTVSGQPMERAMLASALCRAAGKDVPVVPGQERPLRVEPRQPVAQQSVALPRWEHQRSFPKQDAADFMAEVIASHPGEVTLLAVGPMTNVARLFQRRPESAEQLKQVVLMCGRFGKEQIGERAGEWNSYCDPHAAAVVFGTKVRRLVSLGLDVTMKVRLPADEVRRRFSAPILQPVLDMASEWFTRRPHITFHDPLAAVSVFHPDVCGYERGRVNVETEDGERIGETRWKADRSGPVEVGVTVDAERFFERYFGVF